MKLILKFRAWHKEKQKMFLVDYIDFKDDCRSVGLLDPKYEEGMRSDNSRDLILMQFIGVKDKDKKDIYQGDVVEIDQAGRAEVVFESGCFMARWIDDPEAMMDAVAFRMRNGHKWELTVLGNIYENPKLLQP